jgi:hypothetical protein
MRRQPRGDYTVPHVVPEEAPGIHGKYSQCILVEKKGKLAVFQPSPDTVNGISATLSGGGATDEEVSGLPC